MIPTLEDDLRDNVSLKNAPWRLSTEDVPPPGEPLPEHPLPRHAPQRVSPKALPSEKAPPCRMPTPENPSSRGCLWSTHP